MFRRRLTYERLENGCRPASPPETIQKPGILPKTRGFGGKRRKSSHSFAKSNRCFPQSNGYFPKRSGGFWQLDSYFPQSSGCWTESCGRFWERNDDFLESNGWFLTVGRFQRPWRHSKINLKKGKVFRRATRRVERRAVTGGARLAAVTRTGILKCIIVCVFYKDMN